WDQLLIARKGGAIHPREARFIQGDDACRATESVGHAHLANALASTEYGQDDLGAVGLIHLDLDRAAQDDEQHLAWLLDHDDVGAGWEGLAAEMWPQHLDMLWREAAEERGFGQRVRVG